MPASAEAGSNGSSRKPPASSGGGLFDPVSRVVDAAPAGGAASPAEPGEVKAAHRLPTGAHPAVPEKPSSMRPRVADQEPGALFRPADTPESAPRSGAGKPVEGAAKGDVQATVKVSAVRADRSTDATVLAPTVPAADKAGRPDGAGSADPERADGVAADADRSTSRSG